MTNLCEMMWGPGDRRTLLVEKMIVNRSIPKPTQAVMKRQKIGEKWIDIEVAQPPVEIDEFQAFCKAYLDHGTKWAAWVKDSPALQEEVRILWGQLLLVAKMSGNDFAVPVRMLRQWQKVLDERITI